MQQVVVLQPLAGHKVDVKLDAGTSPLLAHCVANTIKDGAETLNTRVLPHRTDILDYLGLRFVLLYTSILDVKQEGI